MLVSVGEVPPGHFTAAGHVTARAVPSASKMSVNEQALPVPDGLLMVNVVMAAFREARNTLPFSMFNVSVPLLIVGALYVSA